jgi:uncharacterized protein YndB with AHSA1/START domain
MPYSYTLSAIIPASPAEIYEAWLDSVAHAEMTGSGEAVMSGEVGAEISALDGQITGRNLELVPDERIVQAWRTEEFGDETEDSIVTILLQATEDGTLLTLEHSNVPDRLRSYEEGGWQSNYFEPMAVYFSEFEEEDLLEPEQPELIAESDSEVEDETEAKREPSTDHESDTEHEPGTEYGADDELEAEPEHKPGRGAEREMVTDHAAEPERHEREDELEAEVIVSWGAPARTADAPVAHARKARGRDRRDGGLGARRSTPRATANKQKVAAPSMAAAQKFEKPTTDKNAVKPAAKKKAAAAPSRKKAAKQAAKPPGKRKLPAKKKSAIKKKSAAKKKTAKPSAKKKAAKTSAQRSAKRGATKQTARSSAGRSRKAAGRKRK